MREKNERKRLKALEGELMWKSMWYDREKGWKSGRGEDQIDFVFEISSSNNKAWLPISSSTL